MIFYQLLPAHVNLHLKLSSKILPNYYLILLNFPNVFDMPQNLTQAGYWLYLMLHFILSKTIFNDDLIWLDFFEHWINFQLEKNFEEGRYFSWFHFEKTFYEKVIHIYSFPTNSLFKQYFFADLVFDVETSQYFL